MKNIADRIRARFSDHVAEEPRETVQEDLDAPFKAELSRNPELLRWLLARFEKIRNNALIEVTAHSTKGNPYGVAYHSGRLAVGIDSIEFLNISEEK